MVKVQLGDDGLNKQFMETELGKGEIFNKNWFGACVEVPIVVLVSKAAGNCLVGAVNFDLVILL